MLVVLLIVVLDSVTLVGFWVDEALMIVVLERIFDIVVVADVDETDGTIVDALVLTAVDEVLTRDPVAVAIDVNVVLDFVIVVVVFAAFVDRVLVAKFIRLLEHIKVGR